MSNSDGSNMEENLEVRECKKPGFVMTPQGVLKRIPDGWALLPPGDASMSRRVKASGPCWTVKKRKGNKMFSLGIWADEVRIRAIREEVLVEKEDPAYQKKLEAARKRRAKQQEAYASEFEEEVIKYLGFHEVYQTLETALAKLITEHAIPVGSGTVARTSRIPIEQRVEAATIAWMRHQTTAYDSMYIPMVKGKRREVRRDLARRSKQLLENYRRGLAIDLFSCPLGRVLKDH